MRRSSEETREHVLGIARDLFYWHGIRATGVDRVAAEAGVAPTTLYRLFADKDDMVAAYLRREAALYRVWFTAAIAPAVGDARARILALFDALGDQVHGRDCRGCPFQMGLAELADAGLPGRAEAVAVKVWTRDRLRDLAAELVGPGRATEGEVLADHLLLVLEGVYASVESLGDHGPAAQARSLVEHLTDPRPRTPGEQPPHRSGTAEGQGRATS